MLTYRLYYMDSGRLHVAATFEADGDAAAVEQARGLIDGRASELWQRGRLLGRLSKTGEFTGDGGSSGA